MPDPIVVLPRNPRHREAVMRFRAGETDTHALAESMGFDRKTLLKVLNSAGHYFQPSRPQLKPRPPRHNYGRIDALIRQGRTASEICAVVGCSPGTVYRRRVDLGLVRPHPSKSLAPIEERLARAEAMLDEGMPFSEVKRTLHFSLDTLRRNFPGRQWGRAQISQHALSVRHANQKIREVWTVDNSTSLTLPPYGR